MIKEYARLIAHKLSWIPCVVSYVWLVLLGCMFISLYLVQKKPRGITQEAWWILLLILATMTYPLYSLGYQLIPGFFGTIFYALLLAFVIYKVYTKRPLAGIVLLPTALWVTTALVYTFARIIDKFF